MNIVFFNQFHNGDCFVGKGWVKNIIDQIPEATFYYAHRNDPSIIQDLPVEHVHISDIPEIDKMVRIAQNDDGDIFINTWCGAFQGELFGYGFHSNYVIQHRMYELYCEQLSGILKRKITQSTNPHDYLPTIDFSKYDVSKAQAFIDQQAGQKFNLICNGNALSGQSAVGDFKPIIRKLLLDFPHETFVATYDFGLRADNMFYTSNINDMGSDLNQIAYLSKGAKLIVGKNSGPFSYCQYKENLQRDDVTFYSFNRTLTDCLTAGLEFPARFKFSDQSQVDLVCSMLHRHLRAADPGYKTGIQHIYV
jgi:hypothetical protein